MIFISTNFLKPENFKNVFDYVFYIQQKLSISVGIEIFPFWDTNGFEEQIITNLPRLKSYPISFHDPYKTDHTSIQGTNHYRKTLNDFLKTLSYNYVLKGHHIVYHHNNCKVENCNKRQLIETSTKNFLELNTLCCYFGTELLVENAGTIAERTMLFSQIEFENFCNSNNCDVLIDVGHAYCNQWDIEKLIYNLGNRIKAFHIHNNFGKDSHNRIRCGGLDYESFLTLCSKQTPTAKYIIEYSTNCSCTPEDFCDDIDFLLSKL